MCIIKVTFLQLDFDLYSMALMLGVDLDILKMYRVHAYLKTKMAFKTRPPGCIPLCVCVMSVV